MEGYMAGGLWARDTMVSLLRGLAKTRRETLAVIESQRRLSPLDGGVGAMAADARRSHKCPCSSFRGSPPASLSICLCALGALGL